MALAKLLTGHEEERVKDVKDIADILYGWSLKMPARERYTRCSTQLNPPKLVMTKTNTTM